MIHLTQEIPTSQTSLNDKVVLRCNPITSKLIEESKPYVFLLKLTLNRPTSAEIMALIHYEKRRRKIFKDLWLSSDHERRKNMGTVIFDMSMSLDGFIAGPKDDANPDREFGALEILHDWMFPPKGNFEEIAGERFKNVGAVVMGRRMFDLGEEPWGDNPVFHAPLFVLRDPRKKWSSKEEQRIPS